ncbi:MAG: LysM peptidoglycan-binding domain-containing protein [Akkermansiaceae bacterium]
MKTIYLFAVSLPIFFITSCAQQTGADDYDVANPYAAPDYVDENSSPYQPVNPTYDVPAVYDDNTAVASASPVTTSTSAPVVHTVVRGDTLWGLSKKYGASISAIKNANGMTKDTVVLGSKLQIPSQ